jgi:hypothetical protein
VSSRHLRYVEDDITRQIAAHDQRARPDEGMEPPPAFTPDCQISYRTWQGVIRNG